MQLKFKKICLLSTIFVYCASFLLQSNFGLFQTWAQGGPQPYNLVVVLVDDSVPLIGNGQFRRYIQDYIQNEKVPYSKIFVMPLNTYSITAYDIHRMLENIYFDGLKDVPSKLVGLLVFGNVPLPVVNQNGYIFPTIYPYVDFEDQKYVWDSDIKYFVPNDNPGGQAEIWHGLINFGTDINAYTNKDGTGFLDKVKKYYSDPEDFIGTGIRYDDFISQKKTFLDDNFKYYRNRIMFAEDLGYQRYSPLMKKLFEGEQTSSVSDIVSDFSSMFGTDDESGKESLNLGEMLGGSNYTTKMVQQEIDTSFVSDYNDLFSTNAASVVRENLFAGSRWIKEYTDENGEKKLIENLDGSTSKLQLKDDLLLGNENLQGLIENLNDLMENMIDEKIEEKNLAMDIVVPISYKEVTKKKVFENFRRKCRDFIDRYENYYFGNNALFIDNAEDFSVYRGTYRNLSSISGLAYDSLLKGKNQIKSDYDKTNLRLKSIGGSYDIFSMQVEGNRGYNVMNVNDDMNTYDENKTQKNRETKHKGLGRIRIRSWPETCDDESKKHQCENLFDFAMRWWGGASPINLNSGSVGDGRYELSEYIATDSWRPIYSMNGFQTVITGDDEGSSGTGWKNGKGEGPQWDATSYKAYLKYASPTQREGWNKKRWAVLFRGYELYQNHTPDVHKDLEEMSYRNLSEDAISEIIAQIDSEENGFIGLSSEWLFSRISNNIFGITKKLGGCGGGGSREYIYKVISSVVKHTSTTEDQINGIDRDKYGETGTLGKYYRDVRVEYEDLQGIMTGSIDAFSGLIDSVNSGNDYLSGKFNSLKQLLLNGGGDSVPNTGLEEKLSELESQLYDSQANLSGLEAELNELRQLKEGGVGIGDDKKGGEIGDEIPETNTTFEVDEEKIRELNEKIGELRQNISDLEQQIETLKIQMTVGGSAFQSVLNEISEYIKRENAQLASVYEQFMSLYTDNIIGALEFIAYLEGGQPEDYYETGSLNLVKVGFLPLWIENLNNIFLEVREGESKVISGYEEVYSLIQKQQQDWFGLAEELKEMNENYSGAINKVSEEMEQIFTIVDDGNEYDENGNEIVNEKDEDQYEGDEEDEEAGEDEERQPIVLTGTTAIEAMAVFDEELEVLSGYFFNLIKEDDAGLAVVEAAKSDNDFLLWLYMDETGEKKPTGPIELNKFNASYMIWLRKLIALNTFTDVDWINKYAQRANGPGYDSDGAKKNHDLLLGVSDHMPGMNILTPDRPIDSPHYVSMQSVAGREMKFIYPDLFKVEVYQLSGQNQSGYDINLLLTGGQIKKNLIKYLTGKVAEYNNILQEECNNALDMSGDFSIHYSGLQKMSYESATPDKAFHSCGMEPFTYEDFVEVLGGEKMLDTISEVLYYQSLTNTRKLSAGNIDKDIELIKETFSINEKRKQILQDYLVKGNEEIKNLIFEIPTYEKKGYEVGYINSDGKDYIFPSKQIEEKTSSFSPLGGMSIIKSESDLLNRRRQPSLQETSLNDECNIPVNGKLPLFDESGSPWLKGFTCWLKKVKEKPFELKLTFDDSLGEVLQLLSGSISFKDYVKNSDLGESFNDRKDSWGSYADEWDEILSKDETSDYDAKITQMQVVAERHNKEVSDGVDGSLNPDRDIRIEVSSLSISSLNPVSNLKISSVSDLGNIKVTFEGTGDGCLKIDSNSLCDGNKFIARFDPKKKPFTGEISSFNNVAGKVGLVMEIEVGGKTIKKILKYTVSPGEPKKVVLKVVGDENKKQVIVVGGMMLPINATIYDENDNVVSRGTEKYKFTATAGRFLKGGGYMDSFETNDFRDLNFYYEVPQNYEQEVYIEILNSKGKVIGTLPINVVKAELETKVDEILIEEENSICYRLGFVDPSCHPCNQCVPCSVTSCPPDSCSENSKIILSKDVLEEVYSGGKLDVSKLHKIDLDLKDKDGKLMAMDNQVIVSSQKGQLVFGQVNKQDNGDDVFFETSKFYMTGGHVVLYYYLTAVAGNEVIKIDVPGVISRTIDLEIQPHSCGQMSTNLRKGYVEIGVPDYVDFFYSDIFGNVAPTSTKQCYDQVRLDFPEYRGDADPLCGRNEDANDWYYSHGWSWNNGYYKQKIVGLKPGMVDYAGLQFEVADELLPDSGLNIMYLNYFGNDRGNQRGYRSDNNKRVESLMMKSEKIITTTTQLISEDKVKKMVWSLNPSFRISNFDGLDTTMVFKNTYKGNVQLKPSGLSDEISVHVFFDSVVSLGSLQDVNSWILDPKNEGKYIFFVPSETGYKISKKMELYNGEEKIGDFYDGNIELRLTNQTLDNGDNVRTVVYNGVNYGNIVIHSSSVRMSVYEQNNAFASRYSIGNVFTNGTTNSMSSIGVFDEYSNFELNTSYKSIQDSDDLDQRIGFIGDFKNITLFAEGESVGEATRQFGSELLINIGDPLLSLKKEQRNKNAYAMNYDGGIGREIYGDGDGGIFGTYIIDYDGNGIDDLLVAYFDGRFKLAKNYAGDPTKYDMRNLQELMRLAVPIREIFVGDVDGNGSDDIIVYTQNDQMRAYLNRGGVFDVDGSLVCLNQNVYGGERSSTPSDLEGMNQFFIEDMDLDGAADIIVNDAKGYIKVFYGGGNNYLSKDKYACDTGWYDRQKDKITEVAAFGVELQGGDGGMMYWSGITRPGVTIDDPAEFGITVDVDNLTGMIKSKDRNSDSSIEDATREIMESDNFDMEKASERFVNEQSKYVDVTLYENTLVGGGDSKNYIFAMPGAGGSKCNFSKTYRRKKGEGILVDGDVVVVTVLASCSGVPGAFGDIIRGPRNIYYNSDGIIKSFRFVGDKGSAVVKKRDGNFAYIVDNIQGGVTFEYELEYHHVPLVKISVTHETYWSDDEYPDIKLQSVDGCIKDFSGYVNQGGSRKFVDILVPLQEMIDEEYLEEEEMTHDYTDDIFDNGSNVNNLPGIVGDRISRTKLLLQKLKEGFMGGSISVDLELFQDEMEKMDDIIDDMMKGMCNGFSFGGANNCKGLPVPFNQAFLAPGKYHLFGCRELPMGPLEGGLPVFFFPGTLPTPFGPIPIPDGLKADSDKFLRLPGGQRPSFIRIYAAPTLTAQLGIAICMGKYMDEHIFPSPLADVAGNCIVFAVKPQCKKGDNSARKRDKNNPNEVYTGIVKDVMDSGICTSSKSGISNGATSFRMHSYSSKIKVKEPCTTSCTKFDEKNPKCGNGVRDAGETCGNCFIDLRYECNACGNGQKDRSEKCDNGYNNGHDGKCKFDCEKQTDSSKFCGNGKVEKELGEQCDLGEDNGKYWSKDSVGEKTLFDKFGNVINDAREWMNKNVDVDGGERYQVDFSTNFVGFIDLDMESYIGFDDETSTENSIFIGDVDVSGGDFKVNKIRGGIIQGVRGFLIDNWLDPQIRYVANQLTKMHINIKLPDVSTLIDSEIKGIQNGTERFSEIWGDTKDFNRTETGLASKLGGWSYINYNNLSALGEKITNPFEALAGLLGESNIINISVEPVTVKIPWIFAEDINSYELYLMQWLEVNEGIIEQWSGVLNTLGTRCSKIEDKREQKICYNNAAKYLASFMDFAGEGGDWQRLQNQIYTNLKILQEYRNFPFEVYEWIHVIDRYLSEIMSLIGSTIGYLSYWTTVNSERFVGYVDAIVLAINIIKTYQLVIDFSTEWSKNCGSCSRDTYDQYSCKLSILCNGIQLPIIQIPNFKLPNITLDLSDINLNLDIVLPSFNFQPLKISLPEFPNLPEPPTIGANIKLFDLPNIPLLPEPPELPELPSFIPEIDMELPILPPAPELPGIPNTLAGALGISKMIGRIYCIVKGKFGLVGESSVKAKIEQLTQRTYEVAWIDRIKDFTNRTPVPVKNYGLDYEISSQVNLQFEFSTFYNYLDTLTKSINNFTTSSVNRLNSSINSLDITELDDKYLNGMIDRLDGGNVEFDLDLSMADGLSAENYDVKGILSDEIEYTDYSSAKSKLQNVLAQFKSSMADTTFADSMNSSVRKIENQINIENVVEPNIDGLEKIGNDAMLYLNNVKLRYEELADLVNKDYDGFLAMIDSQDNKLDSGQLLTFDLQLFNVNSSTRDNIDMIRKSNPYKDILDNKKEIVDGYWKAINSNTAADLGVSDSQYLAMRQGIGEMENQITSLYSLTKPISSTNLVAKNGNSLNKTLLSSASEPELRLGSNMDVAEVIDPSVLSNGIYDSIERGADAGKLAKAVYSDYFTSLIGNNYYKSENHDMILYDDKSVYVKCVNQDCFVGGGGGGTYYSDLLSSIPYEEKYIKFDSDTILKIADAKPEVKNWKVVGQSYDKLSFSWKLEDVDGYLIDLTQKIDYNYEKNFSISPIYVLALPKGSPSLDDLYLNGTRLELIGDKNKKFEKIENLYGTGKALVQVAYYDSAKELADLVISDVDRKWYYARIATLDLTGNAYEISSPWSNQVVAGKQMLGDDVGPEGEAVLYRPSIDENVSEGNNLEGYVGTNYDLIVNWSDDVALRYINLSKGGQILDEKYTSVGKDTVSTKIAIHTKGGREVYNSVGVDQFGNKTEKVITVSYSVPEISITDVSKNPDGKTATIKAELSQDMDQGNVSFQRKRGSSWKTMKMKDDRNPDILLSPGQRGVEGTGYSVGSDIAMYDKDENVIALMDPDTAEIKIQKGYDDKYGVRVKVGDTLLLQVYDKNSQSQNSVFSIYLPVEDCSKIDVGNNEMSSLSEKGKMGIFNGGKSVYDKDGNNMLFISPTCNFYSEPGLEGVYDYDRELKMVVLTLYQPSDLSGVSPIKIWLKIKPLMLD